MKFKRIISIGLFALVLAVWGSILYRVITGLDPEDATLAAGNTESTMPAASGTERYQYTQDVRDPFERRPLTQTGDTTSSRKKKEPVVILPPPYKLSGILFNKARRVATLEAPDGTMYFLSEKDTLDGIQILKIEPKQVLYVYHSQKRVWQIESQE